jgi:NitT/TauT family transport system substrate-binding protein
MQRDAVPGGGEFGMKAIRALAAAVVAGIIIAGCSAAPGSSTAAKTKVSLQLQWFPQAQFAGYFAALDKGFYGEEGLDVTILPGAVDIVPASVVAGGTAQFGISWVPRMLAPRESGADLQVIGQVFQRSATTQVSFADKGISSVADFKGKKIGSWGFGNEFELLAGMRKAGLDPDKDVTIVPQQFDMNAFVAGQIDAAQAMTYNEYAQVLETKNPKTGKLFQASDLNVIKWEDQGTSMLQDAIFASEAWLKQAGNSDIAVKFLKASFRGWIFCRDHPAECVDIVLKHDAKLPKGHQTWQLNEVNALIWPSPDGIGMMDQAAFDRTVQIAVDSKILKAAPTGTAFRNDLAQAALAALGSEDTKGTSWQKATVTLTEGGK